MDAQAILSVSAAVVALTQLVKWMGLDERRGPLAVLGLSLIGIVFWGFSTSEQFNRNQLFPYFAGWIAVATSAAGVFGFTRSAPASLTATKEPPPGAGASPIVRMSEPTSRIALAIMILGAALAFAAANSPASATATAHGPELHAVTVEKGTPCWACHEQIPGGCAHCHWPGPTPEPHAGVR